MRSKEKKIMGPLLSGTIVSTDKLGWILQLKECLLSCQKVGRAHPNLFLGKHDLK